MTRNLFMCTATVEPSARWRETFPDHLRIDADDIGPAILPSDVVWLSTEWPRWQALVSALRQAAPNSPVVVLSLVPEADEAIAALDGGARGYCHGMAAPALFREVELVVRHGGLWVGPELMARVVGAASRALALPTPARSLPPALSVREGEVALAATEGLSNKEIAGRLGITERTVKAHMGAIFEKLGVRDRLQLVLRLSAQAGEAITE